MDGIRPERRDTRLSTSADVARAAGVSTAVVSLVLTGKAEGRVSVATQQVVRDAAQSLGYRPNAAARSLRTGRSHTLALVATDVTHPFFASVLVGAEAAARERGYAMMLMNGNFDGEPNPWQDVVGRSLAAGALDGFILFRHYATAAQDVESLGRNAVLIEGTADGVPSLHLDFAGGARAAVTHLRALGHTRIAYLAADYPYSEGYRIQQAVYREMLATEGLVPPEGFIQRAMFITESATAAALSLLDNQPRPTAILCDDDLLAVGVYKAAHLRGLHIPTDVSVVSVCDIPVARMLAPELTTVRIPAAEIGERAVAMLLAWIETGQCAPSPPMVSLPLIVRDSAAPPHKG